MQYRDIEIEVEVETEDDTGATQPMSRESLWFLVPQPAESTSPLTVEIAPEPGRADPTVVIRRKAAPAARRGDLPVAVLTAVTGLVLGIALTVVWTSNHAAATSASAAAPPLGCICDPANDRHR
jgi:hypothetical protein